MPGKGTRVCSVYVRVPEELLEVSVRGVLVSRESFLELSAWSRSPKTFSPALRCSGREALPCGETPPVFLVGCSRGIRRWSKNGAKGKEIIVKPDAEDQEEKLGLGGDWLHDSL